MLSKIKILNKFEYFITAVLALVILFWLITGFVVSNIFYKETVISYEDLIKNPDYINEFDVSENKITSTGSDPKIYIDYNDFNITKVKEITIDIESLNRESEKIEIFTIDSIYDYGAFGMTTAEVKKGKNIILISDSGYNRGALRLDLATHPEVEMEINNITINDPEYISTLKNIYSEVFIYIIVLILLGLLAAKAGAQKYEYSPAVYEAGAVLAAVSAAVYFGLDSSLIKEIIILIFSFIPLCLIFNGVSGLIKKLPLKLKRTSCFNIILSLFFAADLFSMLFLKMNLHSFVFLAALFFTGYFGGEIKPDRAKNIFSLIYTAAALGVIYIYSLNFTLEQFDVRNGAYCAYLIIADMFLGFVVLLWYNKIDFKKQLKFLEKKKLVMPSDSENTTVKDSFSQKVIFSEIVNLILIWLALAAAEIFIRSYLSEGEFLTDINSGIMFIKSAAFFFNLLFAYITYYFLYGAFGKKISNILLIFVWVFYMIGNYIKLVYHNTLLQAIDLTLMKELFLIGEAYIGKVAYYGIITAFGILVILAVIKIKKIIAWLKPCFSLIFVLLMIIPLSQVIFLLNSNVLSNIDIDFTNAWLDEELKFEKYGSVLYSFNNIKELMKLYPDEPDEYSEEYMKQLKNDFENISAETTGTTVKPDVIVIMAESYFDVNQMDELAFSEDLAYPYREYGKGSIISPRFGGGTAAVEFEALTGLSNNFLLESVIAYTTYFKNGEDVVSAVPYEFNNNGYETVIMHPNTADFYNRENAYKAMGFQKYYSITDFDTEDNTLNDGYYKDSAFGEKLIEIASDDSQPQFIFGITIEGHSPYSNKFLDKDINIDISSDTVKGEALKEIIQFSQSLKDTSDMISNVIDYVNNTERPTLLYVFGDHLPPADAVSKSEIYSDIWTKYATPLIVFSNFTEIETGSDYITPNQLAPQVLLDSGIEHSSYFDFIYKLRENYPVIQKQFDIDQSSEELKIYENIQYDILFGEHYLTEPD